MKSKDELKPNYGPVYAAALYPGLAAIFHRHGYALAVHGSLARDFDIIAVPWADTLSSIEAILEDVTKEYAVHIIGTPTQRNHGRIAYALSVGWGECACDLSFFPDINKENIPDNWKASARKTAEFLIERFESKSCDCEALSHCERCSVVSLSRWMLDKVLKPNNLICTAKQ